MFTAHSPETGGGAVILRSLIKNLPELSVDWKYLAQKPANGYERGFMGQGIMGSSPVRDIIGTCLMLTGWNLRRIDEIVRELLEIKCDAYWVVSHNEGLRIAIDLFRLQNNRPVHLTVHDDWAGALSARSKRYRFMGRLAKKMTIAGLQKVSGVDLISKGMQTYYEQLSNRKGEICHRYLPASSVGTFHHPPSPDLSVLNIGHIGSIYDKDDFIKFLSLLQRYGKVKNVKIKLNMWGYHPKKNSFPGNYLNILQIHKDLPEEKVIPQLSKCDFVYSMYPLSKKLSLFGQTSLPTKLSSYVQASRPIFGHGPDNSTLAEFLENTQTGVMWSSVNNKEGIDLIEKIITFAPTSKDWQKARSQYFGENNLLVMRRAFESKAGFIE